MVPTFATASESQLRAARDALSYADMVTALRSPAPHARATAKSAESPVYENLNMVTHTQCIAYDSRSHPPVAPFSETPLTLNNCGGVTVLPRGMVLNIAVLSPAQSGYLTLWPATAPRPASSTMSFSAGRNMQKQVSVRAENYNRFKIYATAGVDFVATLTAVYYESPPDPYPAISQSYLNSEGSLPPGVSTVFTPVCPGVLLAMTGSCQARQGATLLGAEPDYTPGADGIAVPKRWKCRMSAPNSSGLYVTSTSCTSATNVYPWPY